MNRALRIGTRGSALAMWQANWVAMRLGEIGTKCDVVRISTPADQQPEAPLESMGVQGVFTKELQKWLLDGRIDVAVHSLKDLPTEVVRGLILAAIPQRESPFDVLVSREGETLLKLPPGARLGTGSLRRRSQLLHARPDLHMADIRANVETRLQKLRAGQYEALVLAEAGLKRLNFAEQITEVLSPRVMLSAVGQGALGLEARSSDQATRDVLSKIDDLASHQSVLAERTLLAALRGGCLAPIGAWGRVEDDGRLHLSACVLSADGADRLSVDLLGNAADAIQIGRQAAEQLLAAGAAKLIEQSRRQG
ncbi:MAG TPA: hydroxymethylbilane synthase [Pirellulales bacterium]|nr:hydroxymethylbilane synthase [Pirellulales bacterium]